MVMMFDTKRRLRAFLGGFRSYYLPKLQTSFATNFKSLRSSSKTIPGADGAFNFYGQRRGPQNVGTISAVFVVTKDGTKSVEDFKDEIATMAGQGVGRLFLVPLDQLDNQNFQRWAQCRVSNIDDSEDANLSPYDYQTVAVQFLAEDDPAWYGLEPAPGEPSANLGGLKFFDDGHFFNTSGINFAGPRFSDATVVTGDVITLYNMGTRPVRPVFKIKTGIGTGWVVGNDAVINDTPPLLWGGGSLPLGGFGIRQKVGNVTYNEAIWNHSLADEQMLTIDCNKFSVEYSTVSGDKNGFPFYLVSTGFGFVELFPGQNTIEIFGNWGTTVSIDIEYYDSWW